LAELPQSLDKLFNTFSQCSGIELSVVSHEGYLYRFSGNREDAEELAANAPIHIPSRSPDPENYGAALLIHGERATLVMSRGDFAVAFRGGAKWLISYAPAMYRILRNESIKCPYCGRELDTEIVTCPSCGAKHPFTLAECPGCGFQPVYRLCPGCGRAITPAGTGIRLGRSWTPLIIGIIVGAIVGTTALVSRAMPVATIVGYVLPIIGGGIASALSLRMKV